MTETVGSSPCSLGSPCFQSRASGLDYVRRSRNYGPRKLNFRDSRSSLPAHNCPQRGRPSSDFQALQNSTALAPLRRKRQRIQPQSQETFSFLDRILWLVTFLNPSTAVSPETGDRIRTHHDSAQRRVNYVLCYFTGFLSNVQRTVWLCFVAVNGVLI